MAMAGVKMRWVFLISLRLILILIIFFRFPCTTDAYSDGNFSLFSSTSISTTWKINRFNTTVDMTMALGVLHDSTLSAPSTPPTFRPILCAYNNSRSYTAFFLGFFSNVSSPSSNISAVTSSSNVYLAVWMFQPRTDCVDWRINALSPARVFWWANRDKPVGENATLEFSAELGELLLKDADGSPVWSTTNTNTSGSGSGTDRRNAIRMEITLEGNLVLINGRNNRVIWQSFDHPTDTWLPNQRIHFGKSLTARISQSNLSSGIYSLSVTRQGLIAYFHDSSSTPPREYAHLTFDKHFNGIELSETYAKFNFTSLSSIFNFTSGSSNFGYIVLEPNGHLIFYQVLRDQSELGRLSSWEYFDYCQTPTVCGRYGVCSLKDEDDSELRWQVQCNCPYQNGELNYFKPFEPNNNIGCEPSTPLSCQEEDHSTSNYHTFVELPNVTYFDLQPPIHNTTPEKCKEQCLNNCSCKAAFFQHQGNEISGNCSLQSGELYSLIESLIESSLIESLEYSHIVHRAFIKVQNKHDEEKPASLVPAVQSDHGRKRTSSLVPVVLVPSLFGGLVFAIFVAGRCYGFRMLKNTDHDAEQEGDDEVTEALTKFSLEELKTCTQNFQIKLGQGGFGSVFEGVLCDGNKVAVKRLDSASQGRKEFLAEVNTIGKVDHFNLVKLIGYCAEKYNRLLVYEHMCNGSLDKWIFNQDRATTLGWEIRQKIIRGVAKGLEYLHEECNKKIIHFDIKPQNILLDANFDPKISDFGLAKLIDRNQSLVLTKLKGTPGYLAPELFGGSNASVKADVYSFGVVILETMCGRRNLDSSKSMPLVHILTTEVEENQLNNVLDQRNEDFLCHQEKAVKMIKIGIWCLQTYDRRPSMSMVVKALEGSNMETITNIHSLTMTHVDNSIQVMNSHISAAPEVSILSGPR